MLLMLVRYYVVVIVIVVGSLIIIAIQPENISTAKLLYREIFVVPQ